MLHWWLSHFMQNKYHLISISYINLLSQSCFIMMILCLNGLSVQQETNRSAPLQNALSGRSTKNKWANKQKNICRPQLHLIKPLVPESDCVETLFLCSVPQERRFFKLLKMPWSTRTPPMKPRLNNYIMFWSKENAYHFFTNSQAPTLKFPL